MEQGAQVNSKDETGVCTMHDPRTEVCLKMHTCDSPEYKYKVNLFDCVTEIH